MKKGFLASLLALALTGCGMSQQIYDFSGGYQRAIEATSGLDEPRRRVELRSRIDEGQWIVEVEDRGKGIAEDVRDRLFQPFSSGRVGGVGLGLALSRRFTQMHDGHLELVDDTQEGACFRVTIPVRSEADEQIGRAS